MTTTPDKHEQLLAIEHIKQLKARYFRTMDCQQWGEYRRVFSDDVSGDFGDSEQEKVQGADNLVAMVSEVLLNATTVHHGHTPEITLIDADNASGIWAMEDIVDRPDFFLRGYGHYHETYRREEGEWKISSIKLTRLKIDVEPKL